MVKIWLLIAIPVVLIVLGIIAFFVLKSKKKKFQPDYYTLFVLGLVFFVIGIISEIPVMWILGIVFFILGIVNKDKWKRRKTWETMNKKQKKLSVILMIVLGVLVLGGIIVFLLTDNWDKIIGGERDEHGCLGAAGYTWNETEQSCVRQWLEKNDSDYYQITNFNACADAGYPVMESYPRQCRTPNGTLFVEDENINDSITGSTVDEEQIEGPYAIITIIDNESESVE